MKAPRDMEGSLLPDKKPAVESAKQMPRGTRTNHTVKPGRIGRVLAFPARANVRLVERLTDAFIRLRAQHGRRCRDLLLQQHFRPLADRLNRLGIPSAAVRTELEDLETAIVGEIEAREGYSTTEGYTA